MVWLTFHLIPHGFLWLESVGEFLPVLRNHGLFYRYAHGRRDFLFLASCALVFSVTELLILIQFASATGILAFPAKEKGKTSFVPSYLLLV